VGLHWLEEGESRVGSAPGSDVPLPAKAPGEVGVIEITAGPERRVVFRPTPGVEVTVAGRPVTEPLPLATDAGGAEPTILELATFDLYVIDRDGRLAVRVKDSESPARLGFRGLEYYPIDPRWRVAADFEPYEPPRVLTIANVLGGSTEERLPGALHFRLGEERYSLDAIQEAGSDELFVIFADPTNGEETYGAGRYLYTAFPGADGKAVVDFNKAYNPPCVFTPYATCPLPPPQNRLPLRVEAGEKIYGGAPH